MALPDSCKYTVLALSLSYFVGRVLAEEGHVAEYLRLALSALIDLLTNKYMIMTFSFLAMCEFSVYLLELQKQCYPSTALAAQCLIVLFAHGVSWLAYFHNQYMDFWTSLRVMMLGLVIPMKLISYIKYQQKLADKKLPHMSPIRVLKIIMTPWLVFKDYYFTQRPTRRRFIWRCLIEIVLCPALMTFVTTRWIVPVARHKTSSSKHEILVTLLRINGTLQYWLMVIFYECFQSLCGIFFEITGCTNAKAYEDWWNCVAVFDFWRMWNLPTHFFLMENVFGELIARIGLSRKQAAVATFVLSGVLHDYGLGIAFGSFKSVTFTAFFIMQIIISPLFERMSTVYPIASKLTMSGLIGTSISFLIYSYV